KFDEAEKFLVENYLRGRYFPDLYIPPLSIGDTIHVDYGFCGVELTAPDGYDDILWSTGETTPTITVSKRGHYWLEGTNSRNYRDIDSVFIDAPEINYPTESIFCPDDGLSWDTGLGSEYNYLWNTEEIESEILVTATG